MLLTAAGETQQRCLLADTGAGSNTSPFELILSESDCLTCGGNPGQPVVLRGAYAGAYSVCVVRVRLEELDFEQYVRAVAVPAVPPGVDGFACFRFLNRFTYGNFGDTDGFGLAR
jgi:hypothetical protein